MRPIETAHPASIALTVRSKTRWIQPQSCGWSKAPLDACLRHTQQGADRSAGARDVGDVVATTPYSPGSS